MQPRVTMMVCVHRAECVVWVDSGGSGDQHYPFAGTMSAPLGRGLRGQARERSKSHMLVDGGAVAVAGAASGTGTPFESIGKVAPIQGMEFPDTVAETIIQRQTRT